jgi:hypothetical protein
MQSDRRHWRDRNTVHTVSGHSSYITIAITTICYNTSPYRMVSSILMILFFPRTPYMHYDTSCHLSRFDHRQSRSFLSLVADVRQFCHQSATQQPRVIPHRFQPSCMSSPSYSKGVRRRRAMVHAHTHTHTHVTRVTYAQCRIVVVVVAHTQSSHAHRVFNFHPTHPTR